MCRTISTIFLMLATLAGFSFVLECGQSLGYYYYTEEGWAYRAQVVSTCGAGYPGVAVDYDTPLGWRSESLTVQPNQVYEETDVRPRLGWVGLRAVSVSSPKKNVMRRVYLPIEVQEARKP